jgi:MYXO-CTERM domain-containing protein
MPALLAAFLVMLAVFTASGPRQAAMLSDTGFPADTAAEDSSVPSDSVESAASDTADSADPERWGAAAWTGEPGGCGCAAGVGGGSVPLAALLAVAALARRSRR